MSSRSCYGIVPQKGTESGNILISISILDFVSVMGNPLWHWAAVPTPKMLHSIPLKRYSASKSGLSDVAPLRYCLQEWCSEVAGSADHNWRGRRICRVWHVWRRPRAGGHQRYLDHPPSEFWVTNREVSWCTWAESGLETNKFNNGCTPPHSSLTHVHL